MNSSFFDDDRRELSDEFKRGMDFSGSYLEGLDRFGPEKDTGTNIKSMEDAEQALTDTLTYLVGEGAKKMDSSTVALLVKTISDTRTILSSGDLMREDVNGQKEESKEEPEEQKAVSVDTKHDISVRSSSTRAVAQADNGDHSDIADLISKLEKNLRWPKTGYSIDSGQIDYLSRIKTFVSRFSDVHELLNYCNEYASDESQEGLWDADMIFLLIVYFSKSPEKYISSFVLSPLSYYEDPLKGTRSYTLDEFMSYYNQRK